MFFNLTKSGLRPFPSLKNRSKPYLPYEIAMRIRYCQEPGTYSALIFEDIRSTLANVHMTIDLLVFKLIRF